MAHAARGAGAARARRAADGAGTALPSRTLRDVRHAAGAARPRAHESRAGRHADDGPAAAGSASAGGCRRMLVNESPHIARLTAPNPSLMTGRGTNTYLLGAHDVAVIDPGPDDDQHITAILDAITARGGQLVIILVTHSHLDHLPGAFVLQQRVRVPIAAFAP